MTSDQKLPDILEQILNSKRAELSAQKHRLQISTVAEYQNHFSGAQFYQREPISLSKKLRGTERGLIAEFKRASPSAGAINQSADIRKTVREYISAFGAVGISVLTERNYFGGDLKDLIAARNVAGDQAAILRKDFIIDPLQVFEAKAAGADLILLIARILTSQQIADLTALARQLGLETLLEIHDASEFSKISPEGSPDLLGINNRNLQTFRTDYRHALGVYKSLKPKLQPEVLLIAESGIKTREQADELYAAGFSGLLIGETLMRGLGGDLIA